MWMTLRIHDSMANYRRIKLTGDTRWGKNHDMVDLPAML